MDWLTKLSNLTTRMLSLALSGRIIGKAFKENDDRFLCLHLGPSKAFISFFGTSPMGLAPLVQDCTSRQDELVGITEEPSWKFDPATGCFKRNAIGETPADNTSDLKWKLGMDRRGLAYDQASVLSHAVHTRWISTLIQHKHRTPPPDYRAVSWQQLHTADCELFMLAAQEARTGIRPDIRGDKPLDALFRSLMTDARITFFLMPMPKSTSSHAAPATADSPASAHAPVQHQQQQRGTKRQLPGPQQQQQQQPRQQQQAKKGKDKGKGKGKKDSKKRRPATGSDGSITSTRSGKPICIAYNGAGCQAGVMRGGLNECAQGLHLCNAPKCTSRASHGRAGHTAAHE